MQVKRSVRRRSSWIAAAAVLGTVALASVPAHAALSTADETAGQYVLTVLPVNNSGVTTEKTLRCGPDGGTHTEASLACAQLREVDGAVDAITTTPGPCTREYKPVRVNAHGVWNGEPRHFSKTYGNRCEALRATGGVIFKF
jgi:hypothetical protein